MTEQHKAEGPAKELIVYVFGLEVERPRSSVFNLKPRPGDVVRKMGAE